MWKILSTMDLMVAGAAVVVVAGVEVGVVVPTEAEVEIKMLVASMSPMRMDPHEVGGPTFPRRRHTQVCLDVACIIIRPCRHDYLFVATGFFETSSEYVGHDARSRQREGQRPRSG